MTVLGLLLTVALLGGAYVAFRPQYTAKAAVLLVPPSDSVGNNPYLNLSALQGLNNVFAQALTDTSTSDALNAKGLSTSYTITTDAASSGPIVIINGTAKTGAGALAVVNELVSRLPATLKQLQQSAGVASAKSYVTSTVLNPPDAPKAVRKNQQRALIAAGAAGLVITFLLVAGAERISNRRWAKAVAAGPTPEAGAETGLSATGQNGGPVNGAAGRGVALNGVSSNGVPVNGSNGSPVANGAMRTTRPAVAGTKNGTGKGQRIPASQEAVNAGSKRQRIRRLPGR